MSTLESSFERSRGLMSRRYDWRYSASLPLQAGQVRPLMNAAIEPITHLLVEGNVIENVKGRDRLNLINKNHKLPFEHELFSCRAEWRPQDFGIENDDPSVSRSFEYYVLTPFDHFGGKNIFHKSLETYCGDRPLQSNQASVLNDSRIRPLSFRIGFDFFGQSAFANWFISAPVVLETLLVEADENGLRLQIQSNGHKGGNDGLHSRDSLLEAMVGKISDSLQTDVISDLEKNLKSVS